jgi:hypothetical protein
MPLGCGGYKSFWIGSTGIRMVEPGSGAGPIVVTRRDDARVRIVKGGNHVANLQGAGATDQPVATVSARADAGGPPLRTIRLHHQRSSEVDHSASSMVTLPGPTRNTSRRS